MRRRCAKEYVTLIRVNHPASAVRKACFGNNGLRCDHAPTRGLVRCIYQEVGRQDETEPCTRGLVCDDPTCRNCWPGSLMLQRGSVYHWRIEPNSGEALASVVYDLAGRRAIANLEHGEDDDDDDERALRSGIAAYCSSLLKGSMAAAAAAAGPPPGLSAAAQH